MIVVVEGIDRVGKTTLADMLVNAGFKTSKDEFLDKLKQNTRNYAKRQITYLKKIPNIIWHKYSEKDEIFKKTGEFING